MVVGSIVSFVVALLVGGLAIYISASIIADVQDYSHAVITALIGAIAWAIAAFIPLVGPLLALAVWITVINWRYRGGWIQAILIGLVAWVAALVILLILNSVLGLGIEALGVPGV